MQSYKQCETAEVLVWQNRYTKGNDFNKFKSLIEAILKGQHRLGQVLERLTGLSNHYKILSARINDKERLIFTYQTVNGLKTLIILAYLDDHDHNALRRVLKSLNLTNVDNVHFEYDSASDVLTNHCTAITSVALKSSLFHHSRFISLTSQQATNVKLPAVITGVPGSGKTVMLLNLLNKANAEALVSTQSSFLLKDLEQQYQQSLPSNNIVIFKTYDQLTNKHHYPTITWQEIDHFISQTLKQGRRHAEDTSLKNYLVNYNSKLIYQELKRIYGYTLEQYLAQGERESYLENNQDTVKKFIYQLCINYVKYLNANKKFDVYFASIDLSKRYKVIFVDEYQDCNYYQLTQLKALVDKKNRSTSMVLFGDSNQQLFLGDQGVNLKNVFKEEVDYFSLKVSHRLSKQGIAFCNKILALKLLATGGTAVKGEITTVESVEYNDLGQVVRLQPSKDEQAIRALAQESGTVIIIPSDLKPIHQEELISQIKLHYNSDIILTVAETKGLEYNAAILVGFFNSKVYQQLNNWLAHNDLDSKKITDNRSKSNQDKASINQIRQTLSELFVASSRTLKNLFIVAEIDHKNQHIHQWFKESISNFNPLETADLNQISNASILAQKTNLKLIKDLLVLGKDKEAKSCYEKWISANNQDWIKFINQYRAEEGLDANPANQIVNFSTDRRPQEPNEKYQQGSYPLKVKSTDKMAGTSISLNSKTDIKNLFDYSCGPSTFEQLSNDPIFIEAIERFLQVKKPNELAYFVSQGLLAYKKSFINWLHQSNLCGFYDIDKPFEILSSFLASYFELENNIQLKDIENYLVYVKTLISRSKYHKKIDDNAYRNSMLMTQLSDQNKKHSVNFLWLCSHKAIKDFWPKLKKILILLLSKHQANWEIFTQLLLECFVNPETFKVIQSAVAAKELEDILKQGSSFEKIVQENADELIGRIINVTNNEKGKVILTNEFYAYIAQTFSLFYSGISKAINQSIDLLLNNKTIIEKMLASSAGTEMLVKIVHYYQYSIKVFPLLLMNVVSGQNDLSITETANSIRVLIKNKFPYENYVCSFYNQFSYDNLNLLLNNRNYENLLFKMQIFNGKSLFAELCTTKAQKFAKSLLEYLDKANKDNTTPKPSIENFNKLMKLTIEHQQVSNFFSLLILTQIYKSLFAIATPYLNYTFARFFNIFSTEDLSKKIIVAQGYHILEYILLFLPLYKENKHLTVFSIDLQQQAENFCRVLYCTAMIEQYSLKSKEILPMLTAIYENLKEIMSKKHGRHIIEQLSKPIKLDGKPQLIIKCVSASKLGKEFIDNILLTLGSESESNEERNDWFNLFLNNINDISMFNHSKSGDSGSKNLDFKTANASITK